jgi:hypothetical protein
MASRALQVVTLLLASAALVVAVISISRRPESPALQPASDIASERQIRALSDQITELRLKIEDLYRVPLATPSRTPPVDSAPSAPVDPTALEKRIADLETALRHNKAEHLTARTVLSREDLLEARRTALDPRATERDKLDALRILRWGQKLDGQDAAGHDVVLAMLDVVNHSTDEGVRTFVYANLHGVNDNAIRDAMLRDLVNDPSAQVREKIAGDINTFAKDRAVQEALRQAAANDSDESVRRAAAGTIAWAQRDPFWEQLRSGK